MCILYPPPNLSPLLTVDTSKKLLDITPATPILFQWLVAQAVTTSSALFSYPLDTLRRTMMMQSGGDQILYKNARECLKAIINGPDGYKGLYRGALMNTMYELKYYIHPFFTLVM